MPCRSTILPNDGEFSRSGIIFMKYVRLPRPPSELMPRAGEDALIILLAMALFIICVIISNNLA